MQLLKTLENALRKNPEFVSEEGELNKWIILSRAQELDKNLITLLLKSKRLRSYFFTEYDGYYVFNLNQFTRFFEQKNFLNDSYTSFKNKIGIAIGDKYISQTNDVVLNWPFKDGILEGGQLAEEAAREEIFFNQLLANDEITQLTEPKVLTNGLRLYRKRSSKLTNFTRDVSINKKRRLPNNTITDHMIIKGNNLLALYSLLPSFRGLIKMIYIDPPYYFSDKNKNYDSFSYNTRFKLSTWLVFMKNRLEVARSLLSDSGVIFISIDDGAQAHLKLLMDEIYGSECFIACLPTIMNLKGNNDEFGFSGTHEYTLVYCKNREKVTLNNFPIEMEDLLDNWDIDDIGYFKKGANLKSTGQNAPREKRENLYYPIFIDDKGIPYVTENNRKRSPSHVRILPKTDGRDMSWRWEKKKVNNEPYNIIVRKNKGGYSLYKKQRPEIGDLPTKKPKSIFYKPEYSSGNGTAQIKAIFGEKVFSNPKPIELIKDLISIGSGPDDIVLDFFSGSGTTAHAVLDLNKSECVNRQFIVIEQLDYIETVTKQRIRSALSTSQSRQISFFELKRFNQQFIDRIKSTTTPKQILSIWEQMKSRSFLDYNLDVKSLDREFSVFQDMSIKEQKLHLIELLDLNQLYVNLSSLDDGDYRCTTDERKLTESFYAT